VLQIHTEQGYTALTLLPEQIITGVVEAMPDNSLEIFSAIRVIPVHLIVLIILQTHQIHHQEVLQVPVAAVAAAVEAAMRPSEDFNLNTFINDNLTGLNYREGIYCALPKLFSDQ
jgi:hypothetical protein